VIIPRGFISFPTQGAEYSFWGFIPNKQTNTQERKTRKTNNKERNNNNNNPIFENFDCKVVVVPSRLWLPLFHP